MEILELKSTTELHSAYGLDSRREAPRKASVRQKT